MSSKWATLPTREFLNAWNALRLCLRGKQHRDACNGDERIDSPNTRLAQRTPNRRVIEKQVHALRFLEIHMHTLVES